MIEFRRAHPGDGYLIAEARKICWAATYRGIYDDEMIDGYDFEFHRQKDEKRLGNPDYHYYLVMDGAKVAGYFGYGRVPEGTWRDFCFRIHNLYLKPEYQGRGLGRKIFEHIREACLDMGYTRLYHECNQHNLNAQSFYIRMGGVFAAIDGGHERKYEDQCYFEYDFTKGE